MTPPDAATLLDVLDATWAAEDRRSFGGWALRRGGPEAGSRVSSLRVLGPPDRPEDEALAAVGEQARAWGQPPIVQIGPEDRALDARLGGLGWTRYDATRLLAAPAAEIAAPGVGRRVVVRVRTPLAILDDLWREGGVGPARRACMARAPEPKAAILLRDEADRPAGAAFVAAWRGVAMLHALHVAPPYRRRGLGAVATVAAAEFALDEGAGTLALAVTEANDAARALYAKLGFRDVAGYHYRRAP